MYVLRCGFKEISQVEKHFRKANLIKGEKLTGHVYSVEQTIADDEAHLTAKCVSQVSDHIVYDIHLELTWSRQEKRELCIQNGKCTCKAGIKAQCKHAAAVCLHVNNEEVNSCTSQPQKWGKPSGRPKRRLEQDVMDLFPSQDIEVPHTEPSDPNIVLKYPDFSCLLKEVLELQNSNAEHMICVDVLNNIVDRVSITLEKEVLEDLLEPMLKRPVYRYLNVLNNNETEVRDFTAELTPERAENYKRRVVHKGTPTDLCLLTMGQANCSKWHEERAVRVSSTKAHTILAKSNDDGLKRAAQQLSKTSLYRSAAMHYGIKTEASAREELQQKLGVRIVQTGLIVLPERPWLCCSPDGLTKINGETVLIEIKCTHKYKDKLFINYEDRRSYLPYLVFMNDTIELKKTCILHANSGSNVYS